MSVIDSIRKHHLFGVGLDVTVYLAFAADGHVIGVFSSLRAAAAISALAVQSWCVDDQRSGPTIYQRESTP